MNENIKSGLRLSEAIKLIEENEGALIRSEKGLNDYRPLMNQSLSINDTYSVKLPPPKSVTVTREDVVEAAKKPFIKMAALSITLLTLNNFARNWGCR